MTQRGNGGIIGVQNTPTLSSATGVWSVNEVQRAAVGATWPLSIVPDPNFRNVTLLLNGEGTNGAQNNTFIDSSTNGFAITRNGNTTQGTFSPYGDRWSNYFDGTGDWLSGIGTTSSFNFLHNTTALFTIEAWVYTTSLSAQQTIICTNNDASSAATGCWFVIQTSGAIRVFITKGSAGNPVIDATSTGTIPTNTWTHIAVTYDQSLGSNNASFYINGVLVGNGTKTANAPVNSNATTALNVGSYQGGGVYMVGYISNLRITNSIVYSAAFTPPTAPLTAIANTALLTCQSNRLRDASTNNFTITRNGDVSVQRFSPFSPTAPYAVATIGGSGYFDGNGDSLSNNGASGQFAFGTGAFTVEFWMYAASVTARQGLYTNNTAAVGTGPVFAISGGGTTGRIGVGNVGQSDAVQTGSGVISANAWHHIALVREGTGANQTKIYVDGVQQAVGTYADNLSTSREAQIGTTVNYGEPFSGYLSNVRIVKGTAVYTTNFTPPTAPLTAITNTSLLLNFTNSGVIDNSMLNDAETVGNVQISTSTRKYGTGSISIPGGGANLYIPPSPIFDMGTGDFTIECWVNSTSIAANYPSFISSSTGWSAGSSGHRFNNLGAANKFSFHLNGAGDPFLTSTNTYSFGVWYHYALTRSGNTWRMFIDGVQQASGTFTGSFNAALGGFRLGYAQWDGTNGFYNGFIDDVRVTRGVARYTANFTPPTLALPGL